MKKSKEEKARVLLGVTGSVAAYKALELSRLLVKSGYTVDVVLTEGAELFLTPLAFASLVNGRVYSSSSELSEPFAHLKLAEQADLIVICPATANTLSKLAYHLSDNLLTAVCLASTSAKIVCPAMNSSMFLSEEMSKTLNELYNLGYSVVLPEEGILACGDKGVGRLASIEDIFSVIEFEAKKIEQVKGKRFVITSGGTREWIDDVRFISNASSGLMGTFLAAEAKACGAEVVFITGPSQYQFKLADRIIEVETSEEMHVSLLEEFPKSDVLIMAAAVADFTVKKEKGKIKKEGRKKLLLELEPTVDILKSLSAMKENQVLVGFSLETSNLYENSLKKLKEKNLDLIVANSPANFASFFASATIIRKDGSVSEIKEKPKRYLAKKILEEVGLLLKRRKS